MKGIVIMGTGGNCIDILSAIFDINEAQGGGVYKCVGFLDDNPKRWKDTIHGIKVLGSLPYAKKLNDVWFVFGIGSISNFWKRRDILETAGIEEEKFETIIHPTASVSRITRVGHGTVILPHVTIASGVSVGSHVYILPNSIISHDSQVGDFTCIAGGASISGGVRIGQSCYIGANSTIREGIAIGDNCLVGMGSAVLKDVPGDTVVAGNPARYLRYVKRV